MRIYEHFGYVIYTVVLTFMVMLCHAVCRVPFQMVRPAAFRQAEAKVSAKAQSFCSPHSKTDSVQETGPSLATSIFGPSPSNSTDPWPLVCHW